MPTKSKPKREPAADYQKRCIERILPLAGKDFDVKVDNFLFDYDTGLTGRFKLSAKGKPPLTIKALLIAPWDVFGSMASEDLDAELEDWKAWLATRTFGQIKKANPAKITPFQPLEGKALEAAYKKWKKKNDPKPAERIAAQELAFEATEKRFPKFAKHVQKVWGLPVPRTLIAVQALFESRKADDVLYRAIRGAELQSYGVLERLAERGLARKVKKGRDERSHGRYYRDPPEFLTFAHGGEDNLHFGLWYDLDDKLPSQVVLNYARDSSETWGAGDTPMDALVKRYREKEPARGRGDFRRRFFVEILEWFAKAEAPLHKAEAKKRSPVKTPPGILGGWGVRAEGAASPCEGVSSADQTIRSNPDTVKLWIQEATKRLKAGDARMALVLGRCLHWSGADAYAKNAQALLVGAYEKLGRKALAGITRAHYKDRPAGNVAAIGPADEAIKNEDDDE